MSATIINFIIQLIAGAVGGNAVFSKRQLSPARTSRTYLWPAQCTAQSIADRDDRGSAPAIAYHDHRWRA